MGVRGRASQKGQCVGSPRSSVGLQLSRRDQAGLRGSKVWDQELGLPRCSQAKVLPRKPRQGQEEQLWSPS